MKYSNIIVLTLIVLLMLPTVSAKTGHMNLLTISGPNLTDGGVADLYLEVKPGRGSIYIDSYPLTKLDTQISTRFANEVACDFLKKDCSKYDFFYKIRAEASIVGGPSAGAGITILTISVLSDLKMNEETIITGSINSGGLIGPVGGIEGKVNAAIDNGFTTIIIPKWQSSINTSKIQKRGLDETITIVKAKNLEEALFHFTGKDFSKKRANIYVSKEYTKIMASVAETLCQRSESILANINDTNSSIRAIADNFLNRSEIAKNTTDYYSRASYCFSASLRLRNIEFSEKGETELQIIYDELKDQISSVENEVDNTNFTSLSELETYMIVKERLTEARNYFDNIEYDNISSSFLAYTKERLFSAIAWSAFFELNSREIDLNEEHLRESCINKISEAEDRVNYIEIYLPGFVEDIKKQVDDARHKYELKEYALCLFKASRAKAEANILLTGLSIKQEDMEPVLLEKLEAIRNILVEQESKGFFPLLGYSYYEYSNSLMDHDLVSSLTFAEYSLELSRLDMYFPINDGFNFYIQNELLLTFILGFIAGVLVITFVSLRRKS